MPTSAPSRTWHCVTVQRKIECLERFFKSLGITDHDDDHLILIQPAHGLRVALNKRNISIDLQDEAINHIEEKLLAMASKEVPSRKIGELVMQELKKLDKIGYIRFASVYREFEDASEFRALVDEVGENQRPK